MEIVVTQILTLLAMKSFCFVQIQSERTTTSVHCPDKLMKPRCALNTRQNKSNKTFCTFALRIKVKLFISGESS